MEVFGDPRSYDELARFLLQELKDVAIFLIDLDLRITSWSPGVERLFGYGEADFVGRDVGFLFTPEDPLRRLACVQASRNFLDGFFLRLRTSPRSITTSWSYVVPSMRIEPRENFSKRIGTPRVYCTQKGIKPSKPSGVGPLAGSPGTAA